MWCVRLAPATVHRLPRCVSVLSRIAFASAALLPGCRRPGGETLDFPDRVRASYTSPEVDAFASWETSVGPERLLAVALRSFPPYDPVLRIDFWMADVNGAPYRYARSEVFSGANEIEVSRFEDLSGDGVPDLAAEIMDTLSGSRSVLLLGARGTVDDVLDVVARGWLFTVGPPRVPESAACAIRIWALDPAPDSLAAGWRYLPVTERGVGRPQSRLPPCRLPR